MEIHKSHNIYKKEDFTKEEIERNNILAVMVIHEGSSICKKCGNDELLERICSATNKIEKKIQETIRRINYG